MLIWINIYVDNLTLLLYSSFLSFKIRLVILSSNQNWFFFHMDIDFFVLIYHIKHIYLQKPTKLDLKNQNTTFAIQIRKPQWFGTWDLNRNSDGGLRSRNCGLIISYLTPTSSRGWDASSLLSMKGMVSFSTHKISIYIQERY